METFNHFKVGVISICLQNWKYTLNDTDQLQRFECCWNRRPSMSYHKMILLYCPWQGYWDLSFHSLLVDRNSMCYASFQKHGLLMLRYIVIPSSPGTLRVTIGVIISCHFGNGVAEVTLLNMVEESRVGENIPHPTATHPRCSSKACLDNEG